MNLPHSPKSVKADPELSATSEVHLKAAISQSQNLFLSHQFAEGYWWYTLEANESIAAEFILFSEFLGKTNPTLNQALCRRILGQQCADGSWSLYWNGPGDLGTSIECYWALKLCGFDIQSPEMQKAREFILKSGGPTKARIFTKIHLALFNLAPWEAVPAMPLSFMLAPPWSPINIYEFSSWARACIVPLLLLLHFKPQHSLSIDLQELYPEPPSLKAWQFKSKEDRLSMENFFILADRLLKKLSKIKTPEGFQKKSLNLCLQYIEEHIEKTEDIFPAMAYAALAMKALGRDFSDPTLNKSYQGILNFQQIYQDKLAPVPQTLSKNTEIQEINIHQQCCVSPVWDTPWMALSLIDSGLNPKHPALARSAEWLRQKQILEVYGDWSIKNKRGKPGGWSFEFENHYFPDVDDTIEVLMFFFKIGLEDPKIKESFDLGLQWLLSMQSKNGGWAAFDVDNDLKIVNKIPFSDHGACLDPPTADITARMLEFLALIQYPLDSLIVRRAIQFILKQQEKFGAWEGRWGVNYLYGTWCVLQGLSAVGLPSSHPAISQAVDWIISKQNSDGGWGESCESYAQKKYVALPHSVPSQTAWALMGLLSAGLVESEAVRRGIEFLLKNQNSHGCWDEQDYTGTGFPGHFYIRYHGYRHYFPLMALGKYQQILHL